MDLNLEKLLSIVTALPDPLFILTETGHYAGVFGGGDRNYYHDGSGLVGVSLYDVLPREKADWFMEKISFTITENKMITVEYGLSGKDVKGLDDTEGPGGEIWFEGRVQPLPFLIDGRKAVVWTARNITLRHKLELELRSKSEEDELTGIFNRSRIFEELEHEYAEFVRYGIQSSLIMFDIDFFKKVNDRYGHIAGDVVLRQLAKHCGALFRDVDMFARFGGEEFVVLLPNTEREEAIVLAERLRKEVESLTIKYEEQEIKVNISIGVDTFRQEDLSHECVIKRADEFLYEAKKSGRNRVSYASN